jgi:3-hydroxyacyl-CoA dehydrogenase
MTDPVSLRWYEGVAIITVDNPPVNAISRDVRVGLMNAFREIGGDLEVDAAVIAGSGKTFMAGSDIREFDAPPQSPILWEVIDIIEGMSLPVVAAINGTALGGGFEIALGCHARVAVADAKLGLPEINLGIIPGAGGTQRLPRLVGVEKALDWILWAKQITAADALKAGAIDKIVGGDVVEAAVTLAKELAAQKTLRRTRALPVPPVDAAFFAEQRKVTAQKMRGFEAPLGAIDAVEANATKPFAEGLQIELAISRRLKASDQSKAQRHLFFGEREVARIPDIPKTTRLRPISEVGIVGAGTMGRGIAMACLNAGLTVRWVDRGQDFLDRGIDNVRQTYARDVAKGRYAEAVMTERLMSLTVSTDMSSLAAVDLVIEAAFEDMAVKQDLFRTLDKVCKPGAILATNTSTLNVDQIAAATQRPTDVIGLHFFSPAHIMKLLEVVRGKETAKDVVATAMSFGKRLGKIAVLSGVCFGFIGNRMFEGYVREAQALLLEGATPAQVDKVLTDFGMAMGPCAVVDLAGVDVSYLVREGNRAHLPKDPRYCAVGDALYHLKRYGQKTGKGFYNYASQKPEEDSEVLALIKAEAARLNVPQRDISADEILKRCLYPLINEGAQILDDGIALRPVDEDVVWAAGYGFPRYRGGPLFYADLIGLQTVVDGLALFASTLGNDFGYWTPAPLLAKLAADGKTFKDWERA